jgi:tetratricopeptide (TPR) repeat protein
MSSLGVGRRSASKRSDVERLAPAISRWLLIVVIVASVLALGSIPAVALLVVAALATLAAACALFGTGFSLNALPTPTWLILGLTLYTLLQALPVPGPLVGAVAPANREVWDSAYQVLGEHAPPWLHLSLDPGASWLEVVKGWLYACVFVSAAGVGARRGAGFGATVLLATTLVFSLVCLGHGLSEATRVFGVYTPKSGGSGFGVAPLLNPNNRASYLNLGILCGVSLLAMRRMPASRWLIGLAIPPIIGVSLLTGSRAGLLGLGAGLALLVLLLQPKLRGSRNDAVHAKQLVLVGGAVVSIGATFAVVAAGPKLHHLLFEQDSSKLKVMAIALQLLPTHFWAGIGRGSFESVFPALRTATDNTISSHPENFLVQWASEWGVPVALLALVVGALLLQPRNWGVKSSIPACGLFCGVAALGVQNLFDLGSEVPGVVVAGTAAAGFAWGARVGKTSRVGDRRLSLSLAALVVGGLLVWSGARHGRQSVETDRAWLRDRLATDASWPSFRGDVRRVMLRHPAEPYFPRLAALAAWKSGTENPVPWIGYALGRGMSAGRTHYLLGGYLASRGKKGQALLELRLAVGYDPTLSSSVAKLALQVTDQEDELARCVPEGPAGVRLLTALAKNLGARNPRLTNSFFRQAIERDPTATAARLALARRLLDDVDAQAPACADPSVCLKEASDLLRDASASSADLVRLKARVLIAGGNPQDAVRLLAEECRRLDRSLPCISAWIDAAKRARDGKALHQAVIALQSEDCGAVNRCSIVLWAAGQAALALGDTESALQYLEHAASAEHSTARWLEVARLARQSDQPGRAAGALAHAKAIDPANPALNTELDSVRHATIEQMLRK